MRPTDGMKLLIVEDEQNLANVLKRELTRRNHDVRVAYDGTSGQKAIFDEEYDIVLLDIMLPEVSGLDLCELIQRTYPDSVVVMVSAMTDIQCAVEAMRLGAFDYVTKPFDFSAVELALERAMRHRTVRKMNRLYERHLQQIVSQRSNELSATNADLKETLDKLYNSYQATLRALALALETRGAENRGHFEAVAAYCARLGAEMRLTEREMMALEQGAWLHDIGKIGVPDAILSKPGALTDDERRKVQRHVEYGMQIIHGIQLMEGAARIVEQHHEHYNGGGYPKGLAGEQICLGARIFSVADAIDAITSERPYRRPRTFELAADELVRCSGSQFDPSVVQTFRSVPLAEWKEIRRSTTAESGSERTWKEPHQNASSPSCCLAG